MKSSVVAVHYISDWITGYKFMKKCLLELMKRRPVVVPHFIRDNLGLIQVGDGFTDGSDGKESACNAGDLGSISGLG